MQKGKFYDPFLLLSVWNRRVEAIMFTWRTCIGESPFDRIRTFLSLLSLYQQSSCE